jgi:non-ribosomal peptide synthetase component F
MDHYVQAQKFTGLNGTSDRERESFNLPHIHLVSLSSKYILYFLTWKIDVSVADIFFSIMRGACVCMPSEDDRMNDPAGAARSMGVTWANLTPSVANLMLPEMIPSLKMLVLGGEATSRKNLDDWAQHVDLIVITGPAETTIHLMASEPASKFSDPSNVGVALSGRI